MSRDREETGRFTETVSLDDGLGVIERVAGPVVTSGDVAEALEWSREPVRRKLRELEANGRIASPKTAGRVVWWVDDVAAPTSVDPDDPFWEFEPGSSGESDVSETVDAIPETVDAILYGTESA
ncbi:MAG: hypothetical protein V5A24_01865 [Haloarculaceae archaeon]